MKGYYGNSVNPKRKPGADNFRNRKELTAACAKARAMLRRKTATLEEIREAGLVMNKAVKTLQSWISNINYYRQCRAEDATMKFEKDQRDKIKRGTGPLIPLTYETHPAP